MPWLWKIKSFIEHCDFLKDSNVQSLFQIAKQKKMHGFILIHPTTVNNLYDKYL